MPTELSNLTPATQERRSLEVQLAGLRGKLAESESRARHWHGEFEASERRFLDLAAVREPVPLHPIVTSSKSAPDCGVAVAVWSDWHVAEVVDRSKVRGLNAYSPEIARQRSVKCAQSTRKLWRHISQSYKCDSMLLFLGGDFITGYLHEELAHTNAMAPVEETRFAKQLLIECLDHLVEEKSIKHLRVVCTRGNHGRSTKKMQYKNDYETSFESWIYWDLAAHYEGSTRVEFEYPKGDVHVTEAIANQYRVRCFHGHQIKYNDGIGGLTIPLNKWLAKQDATERADFNLMGHYHMYSLPNSRTILCGSLKGYDEYAASHGFPFQAPLQAFSLLDVRRRMMSQHMPIFCE